MIFEQQQPASSSSKKSAKNHQRREGQPSGLRTRFCTNFTPLRASSPLIHSSTLSAGRWNSTNVLPPFLLVFFRLDSIPSASKLEKLICGNGAAPAPEALGIAGGKTCASWACMWPDKGTSSAQRLKIKSSSAVRCISARAQGGRVSCACGSGFGQKNRENRLSLKLRILYPQASRAALTITFSHTTCLLDARTAASGLRSSRSCSRADQARADLPS